MLLDELLIKIGVDADTQALEQFKAALDKMGQGSIEFANRLSGIVDGIDELAQSAEAMSTPEALEAWNTKGAEFVQLMSEFADVFPGEEVEDFGEIVQQQAEDMGFSLEQVAEALGDVEQASEDAGKAVDNHTESTENNTDAVGQNTDATGQNTDANNQNTSSLLGATKALGGFILASLGLEKASGQFDKLSGKINSLPKAIGVLSSALGAAVVGLTAFVSKSVDSLDAIHQLSNVTGEATDYIYQLGKVAETSGSSAQAAEASILGLSKVIGEAALGSGGGAKAFEEYGLKAKNAKGEIKQTSEVLEDIRHKMAKLSSQEQIAMLSKLGIDGSMIQVLMKDAETFREEMAQNKAMTLGVGTAEDAQAAAEFKDALADFFKITKSIAELIAIRLAPALTNLMTKFKEWFVVNSELISNGLNLFAGILAWVIDSIAEFADVIDYVVSHTVGWENMFYIIGAAILWLVRGPLLALTTALLTNPFTWIIAGIVLLILLVEDFIAYLNGGNSLIGVFIEKCKEWFAELGTWFSEVGDAIANWFAEVGEWFSELGKSISNWFFELGNRIATWWQAVLDTITNGAKRIFNFITTPFINAFNAIKKRFDEFVTQFSVDPIGAIFDLARDYITLPFKLAFDAVKALWAFFTGEELDLSIIEKGFKQVTDWIKKPFDVAFKWVKQMYESYVKPIVDAVKNFSVGGMVDSVKGWFSSDEEGKSPATTALQAASFAPQIAKAGVTQTHNADNSVKNSNNKVTITQHIQSNANPQMIGNAVSQAVQNSIGSVAM